MQKTEHAPMVVTHRIQAGSNFCRALVLCLIASQAYGQGCLNASAAGPVFQMSLLPLQTGQFVFEVNAKPLAAGAAEDSGVGLSRGQLGRFEDMAVAVRFNEQGTVDMRDGSVYRSDRVFSYAANETYHVRVVVDTSTHRYSAYIRPLKSSAETTVGENYAFRTQQQTVTDLD